MKHVCEVCNQQYDSVKDAELCEMAHIREKAQHAAKVAAEAKISEAVNAFAAKYKTMPNIELTEENQKVLLGDLAGKVGEAFDLLLELFGDDDCDDGCCDDGKCECHECRVTE